MGETINENRRGELRKLIPNKIMEIYYTISSSNSNKNCSNLNLIINPHYAHGLIYVFH